MYVRHEQAVVDRVLELAASGVPKLRIAHAFGLSPTTVRRWIRSGGVRVRRPPPCTVDACATRDAVDPFAYAYVLGLYLGDGHIVRAQRTYRLEISCDPKYPGILAEARLMLGRVLPTNRVLTRQRPSVILVAATRTICHVCFRSMVLG